MSKQSSASWALTAADYLAYGAILFNLLPTSNAVTSSTISKSSIIAATEEKHNLLLLSEEDRQLQTSSSSSSNLFNIQLTSEQYEQCKVDLYIADINSNGELDKNEYLRFLSLNSEHYGYRWGFAGGQIALGDLPLEFPMLFHTTACICAYEQPVGVDFGCCEGDNEHIVVYPDDGSMTEEQEAYTELFCMEVYNSYSATFMPTRSPVASPAVTTDSPTRMMTPPPTWAIVDTNPPTKAEVIVTTLPTPGMTILTPPPTDSVPTTPSPITPGTTNQPSISPASTVLTWPPSPSPISTATSSPTINPSSSPTSTSPTKSPISSIVQIGIQYGISSNCGMTASDVMNDSYGITIKDGLISATEVVVVDILNTTYPREEDANNDIPPDTATLPPTDGMTSVPEEGLTAEGPTDPPTTAGNDPFMPPMEDVDENNDTFMPPTTRKRMFRKKRKQKRKWAAEKRAHTRNNGLPKSGPLNRHLVKLEAQSSNEWGLHQKQQQLSRSLVYYTPLNPVVITDVEDVLDQACPEGINCMRVVSTIYVTLEEGDDADEITDTIRSGFQASLQDASFFQAIPPDTVFCPQDPTPSPVITPVITAEPTIPPSTLPPEESTSAPTTSSPVNDIPLSPSPTTMSPTMSGVSSQPTLSPAAIISVVPTSDYPTISPVAGSSAVPTPTVTNETTTSPSFDGTSPPTMSLSPTSGGTEGSGTPSPSSNGTSSGTTLSPSINGTVSPTISDGTSPPSPSGTVPVGTSPPTSGPPFANIPAWPTYAPSPTVTWAPGLTWPPTVTAYPSPSLTWPPTDPPGGAQTLQPNAEATSSPSLSPVTQVTIMPTQSETTGGTVEPTASSSSGGTNATTNSPVAGGTPSPSGAETSTPTETTGGTVEPTASSSSGGTNAPTNSPVAGGTPSPSGAETSTPTLEGTGIVSTMPTSSSSQNVTQETSSSDTTPLEVSITYDLSNDCGLDAEAIMSGTDNTLMEGLIDATSTITIGILNETFPRDEEPTRNRNRRGLVLLEMDEEDQRQQQQLHRNLVYYTDTYPVVINRILDIETGCAPGSNCLLVISTITVLLEAGDDSTEVNDAIVSGMQDSFQDGTFFGAIPEGTVICG